MARLNLSTSCSKLVNENSAVATKLSTDCFQTSVDCAIKSWQRLCIGLSDKNKQMYLALGDFYSTCPEMMYMTNASATKTIQELRRMLLYMNYLKISLQIMLLNVF